MNEWISVDDELPEFTGTYLVTGECIEMEICIYCVDFGWEYEEYEITDWMALPDLPSR